MGMRSKATSPTSLLNGRSPSQSSLGPPTMGTWRGWIHRTTEMLFTCLVMTTIICVWLSNLHLEERHAIQHLERQITMLQQAQMHSFSNPKYQQDRLRGSAPETTLQNVEPQAFVSMETSPQFHVAFNTGCNTAHDWQSYAFFFHFWKSGQPGLVTRVASGCNEQQASKLRAVHQSAIVEGLVDPHDPERSIEEQIQQNRLRYHLHLTPEYSKVVKDKVYKYFNQPFGMQHWMENALGFPNNLNLNLVGPETVIILLDPDQWILRPFTTHDLSNEMELWKDDSPRFKIVKEGQPMAAGYGFGVEWSNAINMTYILNSETEPSGARDWTPRDIRLNYVIGPPYLVVASDMYKIVRSWAEFVPAIYHLTNGDVLSELYAYATAAAHHNLPHEIVTSFMVSDITMDSPLEAWNWIDAANESNKDDVSSLCDANFPRQPHVFHFCQRYYLGPFFFFKYRVKNNFFTCNHELFAEPNATAFDLYQTAVTPDGTFYNMSERPQDRKRNFYALCQLLPRMNQAAIHYKRQHCRSGANYNMTFHFQPDPPKRPVRIQDKVKVAS